MKKNAIPRKQRQRRGATAVEFAMTAPLAFLLLLGALELGHANMVFNTTEAAAYEGARHGIVPGASAVDCVSEATRILEISGIRGAVVSVVPADLDTISDSVQVIINVPYSSNTIVAQTFTKQLQISRACELRREKL